MAFAGALSAVAACAPVFALASISFSVGAVRRNVTISSAVRLSRADSHHSAFLWCVWCGAIVHQRSGLGFRLAVRSRRTASPPLNSSVRRHHETIRSSWTFEEPSFQGKPGVDAQHRSDDGGLLCRHHNPAVATAWERFLQRSRTLGLNLFASSVVVRLSIHKRIPIARRACLQAHQHASGCYYFVNRLPVPVYCCSGYRVANVSLCGHRSYHLGRCSSRNNCLSYQGGREAVQCIRRLTSHSRRTAAPPLNSSVRLHEKNGKTRRSSSQHRSPRG